MDVLAKLASASGRRDEKPNELLAAAIVKAKDKKAIDDLVANLSHKNKAVQSDCINTLYEIGEKDPSLLRPHIPAFVKLLEHKNNRMIWGGMSALARVAKIDQAGVYAFLPKIMDAADAGSVITRDNAVSVLASLAGKKPFADEALTLLMDQLRNCPPRQLAMYAEHTAEVITTDYLKMFKDILSKRLADIETDTMKDRIRKVVNRLNK